MQRLVVIAGRASPEELELGAEVLIGRARETDLRIFDETASRRHARILERDGRTVLEDLESANGVALNGEPVDGTAALFDGDEIRIGDVRLRFESASGADRVTAVGASESVEAALDPDSADPSADLGGGPATARLRLVCDGATACADAADPDEVPGILLALVVDALSPDRATVSLVRGTRGRTAVASAWPEGASAPASTTLTRRVLEEGEAVLVRDALDSQLHGDTSRSMVASRYRSTLAAPLRTSEGVLGYVVVEAVEPGRYAEEDLRALAAAARQAALSLRNLRTLSGARAEAIRLARRDPGDLPELIGNAAALEAVREKIAKAACVDSPVLVTGETGTGKELVARLLHADGPRHKQPFVALNCAALVAGLLESELFGHEKGAFTGATGRHEGRVVQAGKGTLFLDEVGDLPAALQAKLLRVLSEGTFTRVGGSDTLRLECRVVAATNRDLQAMVEAQTFRQDLYYRLAVIEIGLPPLRERDGDVELLAEAAIERLAARLGRRTPRLASDARDLLLAYPWPGNVRELFNVLERALVLLEGDTLDAAALPVEIRTPTQSPAAGEDVAAEVLTLREAEKRAVRAAIHAAGGLKGRTAEILGVSWPTLNRKIREYGLADEVERAKRD